MEDTRSTFALLIANRGFFPASLIGAARAELTLRLEELGHGVILLDEDATRHGAIETRAEGRLYADFLRQHAGEYQGVIVSLPNFGDENGLVEALRDVQVPILVEAYPDELDCMQPDQRRDAFCGKLAALDALHQSDVTVTTLRPHTVHPSSDAFRRHVEHFDRLCRVVAGLRHLRVGAIGARTSAFKTVRIDEVALQRGGVTMETVDLSEVFRRALGLSAGDESLEAKIKDLASYSGWSGVPRERVESIARLGVVLDQLVDELELDALALRCWLEIQETLGVSPCVLLSEMNQRGIPAACEVDVGSAITMRALSCASSEVAACLDWNNNYGEAEDRCILFHCGPVPQRMMAGQGEVTDHAILASAVGPGCSYGCNTGRMTAEPFTFGNCMTVEGRLSFYLGQGRFTEDAIPNEFFGCAGVAEIEGLQDALLTIGRQGHRHHVAVTPGHVVEPVVEALSHYLGHEVVRF